MTEPAGATVLPLFPLTGALLLPGNFLPLNVFEERYRNLVRDALAGERRIGMIQPRAPGADNWGPDPAVSDTPALYGVGCAGRIERHELHADGRYTIVLRGTQRFRLREEIGEVAGYRRATIKYLESPAGADPADDRERLLATALEFSRRHDLGFDADLLASLPPVTLINSLAAALPFAPVEKQALLEAESAGDRAEFLLTLLEIDFESPPQSRHSPPVVH